MAVRVLELPERIVASGGAAIQHRNADQRHGADADRADRDGCERGDLRAHAAAVRVPPVAEARQWGRERRNQLYLFQLIRRPWRHCHGRVKSFHNVSPLVLPAQTARLAAHPPRAKALYM